MIIFITKSFREDFLSVFRFERFLKDFTETLKKKEHTLIDIHIPYKKFRYNIGGISIRGIVYTSWNTYIPLFIGKKSDKKSGYNLIWDSKFEKVIEQKLSKALQDIRNQDFTS